MDFDEKWNAFLSDPEVKIHVDNFIEKKKLYDNWSNSPAEYSEYDGKVTDIKVAAQRIKAELRSIAITIAQRIEKINLNKSSAPKEQKKKSNYEKIDVFVSHAQLDKPIVEHFVRELLFLGWGIDQKNVFCTSLIGTKIKSGDDFREAIKEALDSSKIVFLIITSNYKTREVCIAEMGAAWAAGKIVIPLTVPPITYSSVGVIMEPKQIDSLIDTDAINGLHNRVADILNLQLKETAIWAAQVKTFLGSVKKVLETHKFLTAVDPEQFESLQKELEDAQTVIASQNSELAQLREKYDLVVKTKDIAEVREIESEYSDSNILSEFEALNKNVESALEELPGIVGSIAICDFFGHPYKPDHRIWETELNKAIRDKEIYNDGEAMRPGKNSKKIINLFETLEAVRDKIDEINGLINEKDANAIEFRKQYETHYPNVDLDCEMEAYWEEHFSFKLRPE